MAADQFQALAEMRRVLQTSEQPPAADIAWAPIIDNWAPFLRLVPEQAITVSGVVAGRANANDGESITTSAVVAWDERDRWIRTRNTLYRLGYRRQDETLLIGCVMQPDWETAARWMIGRIGWHTLTWGGGGGRDAADFDALEAAQALKREADAANGRDWAMAREAARQFADALHAMGRPKAAIGALPLALHVRLRGLVIDLMSDLQIEAGSNPKDHVRRVLDGWRRLSEKDFEPTELPGTLNQDAIAAAHKLAQQADGGSASAPPQTSGGGVIVLPRIGGSDVTLRFKEIRAASKEVLGARLPLAPVPADLDAVRAVLTTEFPHAEKVVRTLIGDLRGRQHVRFRHTLLFGPPGGGKSRLVRRLGEAVGIPIGRYDAGSSNDSMFGGTDRAWHSGQPAYPVAELLARRRGDLLMHVDELDKAARNPLNGSIENVLLSMLEPETAARYADKFYEADVDLSHVSFLATVNDATRLQGPLRDRFRILEVPEPDPVHMIPLVRSIVRDLARQSGEDERFTPEFDDVELAIVEGLWRGGSVRRLRRIVEIIVRRREEHPRN